MTATIVAARAEAYARRTADIFGLILALSLVTLYYLYKINPVSPFSRLPRPHGFRRFQAIVQTRPFSSGRRVFGAFSSPGMGALKLAQGRPARSEDRPGRVGRFWRGLYFNRGGGEEGARPPLQGAFMR